MSLLEALLLDPAPFDTWLAYRRDGVKGSGTLNDPWDGSTSYAPAVRVVSLIKSGGDARETIATATGHSYVNVLGQNESSNQKAEEIATKLEDAMVMSL